jgi:hypothetical protein
LPGKPFWNGSSPDQKPAPPVPPQKDNLENNPVKDQDKGLALPNIGGCHQA